MATDDTIVAYTDGGSRGNPGPAGFGVHIESADGTCIAELREALGVATNNVAEYRGLLAALAWALDHGYHRLHVRSDSLLLVCQMRGEYKVKNAALQALHRDARALVARFVRVVFEHIPRERNEAADRLANLAMDEAARRPLDPEPRSRPFTVDPPRPAPPVSRVRPGDNRPATRPQDSLPFDDDLPDNRAHSKK